MKNLLGSLATLLAAPALIGQCVHVDPAATSYGSGDDFVANGGVGIDLGFPFPVGDGIGGVTTYQFIHPSSNGFIYLSDGTPTITDSDLSPSEADMFNDEPRIAVCWDDMNLIVGNGGELLVDTSVANQCTITWLNVVPFGETLIASMQCVMYASGEVDLNYTADAFNDTDAIVGISPGNMAAGTQPASVDLLDPMTLNGAVTTNDMTHELFAGFGLDLNDLGIKLIPTLPGYVVVPQTGACADKVLYGAGCPATANSVQELFPAGTIDICQSGTTITFIRGPVSYTVLDQVPGTLMPAQGNETVWSTLDDGYAQIPLSAPMPTLAGNSTTTLTACTNGFISLTALQPNFTGNAWTPEVAKFEEFDQPTICGPWYDWNPSATGAGRVIYEEIAGIMYVTWEAVTPFNGGGIVDTFQFQFEISTGNITIVYDNMNYSGASAWHTPLFGFTQGNALSVTEDWSANLPVGVQVGTQLPLSLDCSAPKLGPGWSLTTTNIDPASPIVITFLGDANQGPGLPLSVIGLNAPDCAVWLNAVLGDLTGVNVGGSATVTLPIPNNPGISGNVLTAQSLCLTLSNPANVLTSNGAQGTIGL